MEKITNNLDVLANENLILRALLIRAFELLKRKDCHIDHNKFSIEKNRLLKQLSNLNSLKGEVL